MGAQRIAVLWVPDWPVQAAVRAGEVPGHLPAAVHDGRQVVAASALARAQGVRRGMRRRQAQGCCPELVLLDVDQVRDMRAFEPVAAAAEQVVPGIEVVRAGLLLMPADGASRYHGSDESLMDALVSAVAVATGHEAHVGVADGLLAAVLGARDAISIPAGRSAAFLAGRPMADLLHAAVGDGEQQLVGELIGLLDRLGLRLLGDLVALPEADVAARFGAVGRWAHRLAGGGDARPVARRRPEMDIAVSRELDPPAERVDRATFVGRSLAEQLHGMLVERSLTCGRLQIAATTADGDELVRTWRADLGGPGGLSVARITDRVRWQLEGWLSAVPSRPGVDDGGTGDGMDERAGTALTRLAIRAEDVVAAGAEQIRLWGGARGGDLRAHRVLDRVQGIIGGGGVLVSAVQGGRGVRDRVQLRTWGEQPAPARPVDRPWPGMLPSPSPATVLDVPVEVLLLAADGTVVRWDGRTGLTAAPVRLSRHPSLAVRQGGGRPALPGGSTRPPRRIPTGEVASWAGPWPVAERWWSGRQQVIHLQAVLDDGAAVLLAGSADGWLCEAVYD